MKSPLDIKAIYSVLSDEDKIELAHLFMTDEHSTALDELKEEGAKHIHWLWMKLETALNDHTEITYSLEDEDILTPPLILNYHNTLDYNCMVDFDTSGIKLKLYSNGIDLSRNYSWKELDSLIHKINTIDWSKREEIETLGKPKT